MALTPDFDAFEAAYSSGRNQVVYTRLAADLDDSNTLGLTDGVRVFLYLFQSDLAEVPSPPFETCGLDPTPGELTCESFAACE